MTERKKAKKSGKGSAPEKKKVKTKTARAKAADDVKSSPIGKSRSKRPKRKTNLMRLCTEMNKVTLDAVDKEVTKRFRLLVDAAEEDITKVGLHTVLKNWKEVDLGQFHESLQPYIKHYIFMLKRRSVK